VAGFNRNNGDFDYVDAGDRKDNADVKVGAKFDMYAENVHCQHIYFAGCHDYGYASMLTSNANRKGKITLLRHTKDVNSNTSPRLKKRSIYWSILLAQDLVLRVAIAGI
jgi:hypothetical protein